MEYFEKVIDRWLCGAEYNTGIANLVLDKLTKYDIPLYRVTNLRPGYEIKDSLKSPWLSFTKDEYNLGTYIDPLVYEEGESVPCLIKCNPCYGFDIQNYLLNKDVDFESMLGFMDESEVIVLGQHIIQEIIPITDNHKLTHLLIEQGFTFDILDHMLYIEVSQSPTEKLSEGKTDRHPLYEKRLQLVNKLYKVTGAYSAVLSSYKRCRKCHELMAIGYNAGVQTGDDTIEFCTNPVCERYLVPVLGKYKPSLMLDKSFKSLKEFIPDVKSFI